MSDHDPANPIAPAVTRRAFAQVVAATAVAGAFPFQLPGRPPMPTQSPNATNELCFLSAIDLVARLRKRQVSAREALLQLLAHIERNDAKANAIVTLFVEGGMAEAARAD